MFRSSVNGVGGCSGFWDPGERHSRMSSSLRPRPLTVDARLKRVCACVRVVRVCVCTRVWRPGRRLFLRVLERFFKHGADPLCRTGPAASLMRLHASLNTARATLCFSSFITISDLPMKSSLSAHQQSVCDIDLHRSLSRIQIKNTLETLRTGQLTKIFLSGVREALILQ